MWAVSTALLTFGVIVYVVRLGPRMIAAQSKAKADGTSSGVFHAAAGAVRRMKHVVFLFGADTDPKEKKKRLDTHGLVAQ